MILATVGTPAPLLPRRLGARPGTAEPLRPGLPQGGAGWGWGSERKGWLAGLLPRGGVGWATGVWGWGHGNSHVTVTLYAM